MDEISLKALKQEYTGKCIIIPCADLPKYEEDAFDDTRNDLPKRIVRKDWCIISKNKNILS